MADGFLGVAGRIVEREAGAEQPEEDGGTHARDRRHVQLPHEEAPLAILHLKEREIQLSGCYRTSELVISSSPKLVSDQDCRTVMFSKFF